MSPDGTSFVRCFSKIMGLNFASVVLGYSHLNPQGGGSMGFTYPVVGNDITRCFICFIHSAGTQEKQATTSQVIQLKLIPPRYRISSKLSILTSHIIIAIIIITDLKS